MKYLLLNFDDQTALSESINNGWLSPKCELVSLTDLFSIDEFEKLSTSNMTVQAEALCSTVLSKLDLIVNDFDKFIIPKTPKNYEIFRNYIIGRILSFRQYIEESPYGDANIDKYIKELFIVADEEFKWYLENFYNIYKTYCLMTSLISDSDRLEDEELIEIRSLLTLDCIDENTYSKVLNGEIEISEDDKELIGAVIASGNAEDAPTTKVTYLVTKDNYELFGFILGMNRYRESFSESRFNVLTSLDIPVFFNYQVEGMYRLTKITDLETESEEVEVEECETKVPEDDPNPERSAVEVEEESKEEIPALRVRKRIPRSRRFRR